MEKKAIQSAEVRLDYFQKGDRPEFLLHTGTHGDEAGVVRSVERVLAAVEERLPAFIWVPEASPSAVAAGARRNAAGVDLNRTFKAGSESPETRAHLEIIGDRHFRLFFSVHEDPTTDRFYLYDQVTDASRTFQLAGLLARVQSLGVGLYDGLDDEDPILGNQILDGYFSGLWKPPAGDDGTIETWLARRRIADRIVTAEVPGRVDQRTKDRIVAVLLDYVSRG